MCQEDHLLVEIAEFIENLTGFNRNRVAVNTTLLSDIGLDGEDAIDFLLEFSTRFNVDMSSLRFSDHFGTEGLPLYVLPGCAWALLRFLWYMDWHKAVRLKPIYVRDLINAARAGRWNN